MKDDKPVPFEELIDTTKLEVQSIIRILDRKELIMSDEVLEEIGVLKKDIKENTRGWEGELGLLKDYINFFNLIY